MKRFLICCIMICTLEGCHLIQPNSTTKNEAKAASGQASYYANKFHGRKTASGEVYDKNKLTAAHKTLAFGTKVEVKNLKNSKSVIVKINDRMPNSSSRIIDLSRAAAQKIDMIQDGIVNVELSIVK